MTTEGRHTLHHPDALPATRRFRAQVLAMDGETWVDGILCQTWDLARICADNLGDRYGQPTRVIELDVPGWWP